MGRFLSRGFASAAHLFLLHRFFVRSHSRVFVPTRPLLTAARTGAVRVGRRTNLSACSALARPYLDGSDTTARLTRSGRRSEGGLPSGADHRAATLYSVGPGGPDHDAVMRIGGEAPRRRTHSRNRCQHHGLLRVTATSDRHRMPTKSRSSGSESLSCLSSPLTRLATRRQLAPRQWLPDATGRLAISAPELRSLSCAFCRPFQSVYDTIGPMRYPSGRAKSAKPTESFRGVLVRCPPWRALSLAVCCRSRLARQ